MKLFKVLFLGLVVAFIVTSCAKDSGFSGGRHDVFAVYKLVYDASTYSSLATAEFFDRSEDGSKLDLGFTAKAKVTFAGQVASYKPSTFTFYREYANKQTNNKIVYYYTDKNLELTNTIQLPKDISLPGSLTTIDKSAGVTINFGGDAIGARETVTLTIGNLKFENILEGSKTFTLTPNDLASLATGSATVQIEREKWTEASQATPTGGKMIGINRTAVKTVTVI